MELSWTTFILEIINFLVLVWILKRFLYKPVLEVIARRKAGIDKQLADAKALHAEAQQLQQKYEDRLAEWAKERQQASQALTEELQAERTRRLEELRSDLDREREKAAVAEERRQADVVHNLEQTALRQGARFATRLLEQAAGPDMHQRLVELLVNELSALPPERIAHLCNNLGQPPASVRVASALALDDASRDRLRQALRPLTPTDSSVQFDEDPELLAGLQVTIGSWVLAANLRDELEGFGELFRGD
jgi:F-type H+-transporting ATPase subunit b